MVDPHARKRSDAPKEPDLPKCDYASITKKGEGVYVVQVTAKELSNCNGRDKIGAIEDMLRAFIRTELPDRKQRILIADLSAVESYSTTGVGMLIKLSNTMHKIKGQLILMSERPALQSMLQTTKLERFFTVVADMNSATAANVRGR